MSGKRGNRVWVIRGLSVLSSQFFHKSKVWVFFFKKIGHKLQHKLHRRNNLPDVTFSAWAPGVRGGDASSLAWYRHVGPAGVQPSVATVAFIRAEVKLICHQSTISERPPSPDVDSCYFPLSFKCNGM